MIRPSICLVIGSLAEAGGAERTVVTFASEWSDRWDVVILTLDDGLSGSFYPIDPRVTLQHLGVARSSSGTIDALRNALRAAGVLRRAIQSIKPAVCISFLDTTNVLTLFSTAALRVPVIVSELTMPGIHPLPKIWSLLRRILYRRAAAVVVQTERAAAYFRRLSNVSVIPNGVPPVTFAASASPIAFEALTLLAVGRLATVKRFDLLIRVFERLSRDLADWRLIILGDGPERERLEQLVVGLGLQSRVELRGRVANPQDYYAGADLFVLTSSYEGFPTALCEAMASALPVVAFDCPAGPAELIRDQVDGLLIENGSEEQLESALRALMTDGSRREAFAARSAEIVTRFNREMQNAAWKNLVQRAAGDGRKFN